MRPGVIFPGLCQCVEFPCVLLTPLVRRHEAYPARENLCHLFRVVLLQDVWRKNRLMRVYLENSCLNRRSECWLRVNDSIRCCVINIFHPNWLLLFSRAYLAGHSRVCRYWLLMWCHCSGPVVERSQESCILV